MSRLDEMSRQLASLETELSALAPISEKKDAEAMRVATLGSALLAMIAFLRQEIIRHQADCMRKESLTQQLAIVT
jgi:hypothetical protein